MPHPDPSPADVRHRLRERSRVSAESIVRLAEFPILYQWELANQYWPDDPCYDDVRTPWWLFLTDIGPLQLGWRKRVIAIDWRTCDVRVVGGVTADNVTKSDTMVHAWSVEKAVEYLRSLRKIAVARMNTEPGRSV